MAMQAKDIETLIKEGVSLHRKTQAVAEEKWSQATQRMSDMAEQISNKTVTSVDRLETIFEDRVIKALIRQGYPTPQDWLALQHRVRALEEALMGASRAAAAGKAAATGGLPGFPRLEHGVEGEVPEHGDGGAEGGEDEGAARRGFGVEGAPWDPARGSCVAPCCSPLRQRSLRGALKNSDGGASSTTRCMSSASMAGDRSSYSTPASSASCTASAGCATCAPRAPNLPPPTPGRWWNARSNSSRSMYASKLNFASVRAPARFPASPC